MSSCEPDQVLRGFCEVRGSGVSAVVESCEVRIGTAEWCHVANGKDGVWARVDDRAYGPWRLRGTPRTGVAALLARLRSRWQLALLTGDHEAGADAVRQLFPQEPNSIRCRQQPQDKLNAVNQWEADGQPVLMVGDGLNDAGALRAGTAGIAVSDQQSGFFPACDGLLQGSALARLDAFLAYASASKRLVMANMALSLLYNCIGLSFAVSGHLSPVIAALLMPASSISVLAISAAGSAALAHKYLQEDAP